MMIDVELPSTPAAPARARGALDQLGDRISAERMRDVRLLVSELVTNAVRHGGAGEDEVVVLHLALAPACLRIEVCDPGMAFWSWTVSSFIASIVATGMDCA